MMTIAQNLDAQRPIAPIEREIAALSAAVSRYLAGRPAPRDEVRDLVQSLCRVEDAFARVRAGREGTVRQMVAFVAFRIGCRPVDLLRSRRTKQFATARFAIMWVARKATPYSYPQIGRALGGFDHTSILHGVRRAEVLRETDPTFRRLSDELLAQFDRDQAPEEGPTLLDGLASDRHG